eukprot:Protomagalhaensia_wolfi_Nauph_80__5750@NODE_6_length_6417_cov_46_439636_g4_i0_p4_GENE_NODE_6_length_6417_cov_46_439636_g4_i0NODE_6_length_6417_cov_46_439636_g4_i0_p4_ORF_typecomplete_len270_score57_18_NODE_6_length_6417_cov_46_439636_g4_i023233132
MRLPMRFLPLIILVAQASNEVSMPNSLVQQPKWTIASRERIPVAQSVDDKVEDGAPVQAAVPFAHDHVGQGFLRKALDVLDARLADRLHLNAHLSRNKEEEKAPEEEDEENAASQPAEVMVLEEVQDPPMIRSGQQPPRSIDDMLEIDEGLPEFEREIKEDPAVEQFEANRLIPVELDVNEGVDDGEPVATEDVENVENVENLEQFSPGGGGKFRMIGSATAGIGVIGSVGYCMLSRRRRSKRVRAELPLYDMPASADKGRRRGLAKYR